EVSGAERGRLRSPVSPRSVTKTRAWIDRGRTGCHCASPRNRGALPQRRSRRITRSCPESAHGTARSAGDPAPPQRKASQSPAKGLGPVDPESQDHHSRTRRRRLEPDLDLRPGDQRRREHEPRGGGAVDKYLAASGRLVLIERAQDIRTKVVLKPRVRSSDGNVQTSLVLDSIVDAIISITEHQTLPVSREIESPRT